MKPVINLTKAGHVPVYGRPDAGKSTGIQSILHRVENQRIAIIDFHNEYTKLAHKPNVDRFIPNAAQRNNKGELLLFLRKTLKRIKRIGYDIIVIDEFNQYIQNSKHETPYELQDLKNNVAHDGETGWNNATVFYLMRTPAQGDSEFRETALYILAWHTPGNNSEDDINKLSDGAGTAAKRLTDHKFVMINRARNWGVFDPVPLNPEQE